MADIFISYSRSHLDLTRELVRKIESTGLTVWWDTSLLPNQFFRKEIDAQLKECKAAVIVWTADSVKSDWVLAEADDAWRQGKLINTHARDIVPEQIPKPFNQLHSVPIENVGAILAATASLGVITKPSRDTLPRLVQSDAALAKGQSSVGRKTLFAASLIVLFALGVLVWQFGSSPLFDPRPAATPVATPSSLVTPSSRPSSSTVLGSIDPAAQQQENLASPVPTPPTIVGPTDPAAAASPVISQSDPTAVQSALLPPKIVPTVPPTADTVPVTSPPPRPLDVIAPGLPATSSRPSGVKEPLPRAPRPPVVSSVPPARSATPKDSIRKSGRCTSIMARCAIEIGGRCDPETGKWEYGRNGAAGTTPAYNACISRTLSGTR